MYTNITVNQRRIKLQDSQLNEIPQYLVRPCVKSPTVARAARDFRYQDNTGMLSLVSGEWNKHFHLFYDDLRPEMLANTG